MILFHVCQITAAFALRPPQLPRSPFSTKAGARSFLEEEDDEDGDADPHDDLLAVRQINGDSEAEDEGTVFDDASGNDDDDASDDDIDGDSGGAAAAVAGADADVPAARRSEREGRFKGALVNQGCYTFAPRPTPRKKHAKPAKRMRDRVKNRAHYAARTAAARKQFLVLASSAVSKLGVALDAWGLGNDRWFVPIADPGQLGVGSVLCVCVPGAYWRAPRVPSGLGVR